MIWLGVAVFGSSPVYAEDGPAAPADTNARAKAALAPAGPCAEPRRASLAVRPPDFRRAGDPDDDETFRVRGPIADLFDPVEVGSGPGLQTLIDPPVRAQVVRGGPTACDVPGTGCGVGPMSPTASNPPIVPGTRPTP